MLCKFSVDLGLGLVTSRAPLGAPAATGPNQIGFSRGIFFVAIRAKKAIADEMDARRGTAGSR